MTPEYYNAPCPICGETSFTWGEVRAQGLGYISNDASFLERIFTLGNLFPARHCETCGNIQIFSRWATSEEEYLAALKDEEWATEEEVATEEGEDKTEVRP